MKKISSRFIGITACLVILIIIAIPKVQASSPETSRLTNISSFDDAKVALIQKKSKIKQHAIEWLATQAPQNEAKPLLEAWLEGDLHYRKDDQSLFVIPDLKKGKSATPLLLSSTISDATIIENKRDFTKIRSNNSLRSAIREALSLMDLNSPDEAVRLASVKTLMGAEDPIIIKQLQAQLVIEKSDDVREQLTLALAVNQALNSTDTAKQLDAINILDASKDSVVFGTLTQVIAQEKAKIGEASNLDGNAQAKISNVVKAATLALGNYNQKQKFYTGAETVFFGLSMGSVLVLAGIGLAITFGVMGVINMAHGELIMIGAYTTYVIQQLMPNSIGASILISIPAAFIVSGCVGILIERTVIKRLYGRPLETLLATFGLSLLLQQTIRTIFSSLNRPISTPDWMSGALQINPMLSLTYNRLYIIIFCFMVFFALLAVLKKTPLGLQVRAVSQNRVMARAMGVRSERVDALTFGLGSGVAGIAGVALTQLSNVGPEMGQDYIIDSFMVVVFGGVGNLWGTLVAGLSLGIFNKLLEPWVGAVLSKILVLVFIILFIQKRPRGLFPQRGRAAE